MQEEGIQLIKNAAAIFKGHKEEILANWLRLVRENGLIDNEEEFEMIKNGFDRMLDDFTVYLLSGSLNDYYEGNAKVGREIAMNDIVYKKYINAFHLFEDSYSDILLRNINPDESLKYFSSLDKLHHNTISIVSQLYFDVKDRTVFALAQLAELRDPETGYHLERTREYSVLLAKELGCSEDYVNQLYRVGPLHDIGKVGIRDSILLKPDRLTYEEYEEMKKHTIIGARTITQIIGEQKISRGYLLMARDIILHHHEKYNGSGYPDGLAGEKIPLSARIFALADAYDAIVSKRPYKGPLPHEVAVERIKKDVGIHFDPAVAEVFLKISDKFKNINEKYKDK